MSGRALRPEVRMNKEQEEAVVAAELKALRALVYELESYFSDSGWQHLAREVRLRRIWAAGRDVFAGREANEQG